MVTRFLSPIESSGYLSHSSCQALAIVLGGVLAELVRFSLYQESDDETEQSENRAENLDDQNLDKSTAKC